MGFGDLKSDASLKTLNEFLADKSYIDGYTPTAGDAVVFAALSKAPAATLCHALRWYNHIKSYGNDSAKFAGAKKPVASYGPAGAAKADDDDDDFDLFGDDEEDEDAAEQLKQKRIAEYSAKKAKTEEAPKVPDATKKEEEDDDDFDLFGSETEEDKEAQEKLKKERVEAYTAKKSKKPVLIAKSSIILDVKPWDDETDMAAMEKLVRSIEADGLKWGASKLVPLAYGIKKLQIICVVEDDKIGTDFLEDKITGFEDVVQSMDIAAFNKI